MTPRFSLLFDLDGTLVDSDALHLRAFAEVLAESGYSIDEIYYRTHIAGRSNDLVISDAFPDLANKDRQALASRKEYLYRASLADIRVMAGAADLLEWADASKIRCAVVTTSPRVSVERVLSSTGLDRFFSLLVVGDEVMPGKPNPLPYRTALAKLGIDQGDAVAFEDSLPGITSAKGAGIRTIGMHSSLAEGLLLEAGAVRTAKDFFDADMREWLSDLAAASRPFPSAVQVGR